LEWLLPSHYFGEAVVGFMNLAEEIREVIRNLLSFVLIEAHLVFILLESLQITLIIEVSVLVKSDSFIDREIFELFHQALNSRMLRLLLIAQLQELFRFQRIKIVLPHLKSLLLFFKCIDCLAEMFF